jgi:hypothetical protein
MGVAFYLATFLGVHMGTAVEVRFGLPLYLLLFPLAGLALRDLTSRPRATRVRVAMVVLAYAGAGLVVSEWLRRQVPLLN